MKISYNWLKQYITTDLPAEEVAKLLTNCGLEVESVENYETIKGGLAGMVIGEVKTKEKHPDADRLSVTTVDIGTGTLLNIVCGAANVAAGQKVVVATIGAMLYPSTGEPFQIKKSKIRGALSEGMICAEDEIGLGNSHEGILVLDASAQVGSPASAYFNIQSDQVFEIGLTPNRADAASHVGVARDLAAVLNLKEQIHKLALPDVSLFQTDNVTNRVEVVVEDTAACPRYSGITISGIKVKGSPAWLKEKLSAIGIRSINNIVDVTNYVLHEIGQPLHAFDADKISGKKVTVKKLAAKTKFKTLDEAERELSSEDLMICDSEKGMCIAGVFGGIASGVTEQTTSIFLESAYFDAVHVRKTSKRHGLKTDASFRFERGTDPNITVYALKRAALLIKEVAGGNISSDIVDIYPQPVENFKIAFSYTNCDKLIGTTVDREVIKNILRSLEIEITSEGNDALLLSVPPFKVDVQREADVVEEVLRIYGYNNIAIPGSVRSSLSYAPQPDPEKIQEAIANLLSANGFHEIITNSLTKAAHYTEEADRSVTLLNPLSNELSVMRQSLMYGGLESIAYNINRKNPDLKFFEFGKTYFKANGKYIEERHLAIYLTGRKNEEAWNEEDDAVNFYDLKRTVNGIAARLGLQNIRSEALEHNRITGAIKYSSGKIAFSILGKVKRSILKDLDIKQEVYYAGVDWEQVMRLVNDHKVEFTEVPRFPEVRRDLALLVDKAIRYEQLEQLAFQTEKKILRKVNLFDVYEGDKIEKGKVSYALSFILQDEEATLTDKQIEGVMQKLQKTFEEKAGAKIRS
jgi:phenylalanyl-tRNA synthetase beta chain